MGYIAGGGGEWTKVERPASRRRRHVPEPPRKRTWSPAELDGGTTRQVSTDGGGSKRGKERLVRAEFVHTSILTAIRRCVSNLHRPRPSSGPRRHRHCKPRSSDGSTRDLLTSLKCDLRRMSEARRDACSDPFLLLPAMMCKLNRLEECFAKALDCEKRLALRKDVLVTADCIGKALVDQLHADERLLREKKKKLCCLLRSLEVFRRQLECSNRALEAKCKSLNKCLPRAAPVDLEKPCTEGNAPCDCADKADCKHDCPGKVAGAEECPAVEPACAEPTVVEPEVTGMNLVYTRTEVERCDDGEERSSLRDRLAWDSGGRRLNLTRDGRPCDDPALRERADRLSRMWMESARRLLQDCPDPPLS